MLPQVLVDPRRRKSPAPSVSYDVLSALNPTDHELWLEQSHYRMEFPGDPTVPRLNPVSFQLICNCHRLLLRFPWSRDELSRARLRRFFGAFRSLIRSTIPARNRPNAAADFLIRFVRQIGQRHAQRPVWSLETTAVQQHNPVILS